MRYLISVILGAILVLGISPSFLASPAAAYSRVSVSTWNRLAMCESTGRWRYNGGSGFDGGLQFSPRTWRAYRLRSYPRYAWQATRYQQMRVAQRVLNAQGWRAWPVCSRKILRRR